LSTAVRMQSSARTLQTTRPGDALFTVSLLTQAGKDSNRTVAWIRRFIVKNYDRAVHPIHTSTRYPYWSCYRL